MDADRGSALSEGLLERSVECECLERVLERAAAGSGSLVLVEGEAGVGKSSLLDAVAGEAAWRDFAWLGARGRELERDLPFGVARELMVPLLRRPDGTDLGTRSAVERAGQVLAPSIDLPRPGTDPRPAVIEALVAVVDQLIAGDRDHPPRRVLVTVDDAHWADGSSLRFLGHLADRSEQRPLALVVALRPDTPHPSPADLRWLRTRPGVQVLRPAPLSEAAVEQLVRARFPRCQPKFWAACAEVSGGNPFLLGEVLSALADDDVEGTNDDAETVRTLVPDAVLRSTLARLGRLAPEAAALARAVAVMGMAPLHEAAALAALQPHAAEDAADALARAALVRPDEPLRFVHPLVASAVYSDMAPFSRSRTHRHAAELLVDYGAAPERVGGHLLATRPDGDPWVVDRLRRAGAAAIAGGEPFSAVRFLGRALAEPPPASVRADVLLDLARAEAQGGDQAAVEHLDEALALLHDPARRARTALELTGLLFARLQIGAAAKVARRGLADAAAGTSPGVADALLAIDLTVTSLSPERPTALERVAALHRAVLAGSGPRTPELLTLIAITASCAGDSPAVVLDLARRVQDAVPADPFIAEIYRSGSCPSP